MIYAEFKSRLVELADTNKVALNGAAEPVRALVDSADVVFGIWRDEAKFGGIDLCVIKGVGRLDEIAKSSEPTLADAVAFPVLVTIRSGTNDNTECRQSNGRERRATQLSRPDYRTEQRRPEPVAKGECITEANPAAISGAPTLFAGGDLQQIEGSHS